MRKWSIAVIGSLILNFLLFAGGAFYIALFGKQDMPEPIPMEIEFVSAESAAKDSGGAPQVTAPKPEKVDMPAPLTEEQVQAVKEGVPVDQILAEEAKTKPASNTIANNNTSSANVTNSAGSGDGDSSAGNQGGQGGDGDSLESTPPKPPGETRGARRISMTAPVLPDSLRNTGFEGRVVVGFTVGTDGAVTSAWIESSSKNDEADAAAVSAAYTWVFEPALRDGQPVPFTSKIGIGFEE